MDVKTALVLAGAALGLWLLRDRSATVRRFRVGSSADCIGAGDDETLDACLQWNRSTAAPVCLDMRDCTDEGCAEMSFLRCLAAFGGKLSDNPFADAQEQGGLFGSQFLE